jgi:hypothetical protein
MLAGLFFGQDSRTFFFSGYIMHIDYERIALWILVIVMFIKLFVFREMYTASSPLSIMDLAEFSGLPDDLKQVWQTNIVNTIMSAFGTKFTQAWASVSAADKQAFTTQVTAAATQLATNIQNAPIVINSS